MVAHSPFLSLAYGLCPVTFAGLFNYIYTVEISIMHTVRRRLNLRIIKRIALPDTACITRN